MLIKGIDNSFIFYQLYFIKVKAFYVFNIRVYQFFQVHLLHGKTPLDQINVNTLKSIFFN